MCGKRRKLWSVYERGRAVLLVEAFSVTVFGGVAVVVIVVVRGRPSRTPRFFIHGPLLLPPELTLLQKANGTNASAAAATATRTRTRGASC
jgi:hypothetical protein